MDFHQEMPKKIDFTEKFYDLFHATEGKADFVTVPKLNYITSDGNWHQMDEENRFEETHKFLWWLAFSMKFRLKRIGHETFEDYSMPPREATWPSHGKDVSKWKWKLKLLQPNSITESILKKSVEVAKMKQQDMILPPVYLESTKPWLCIQTLHIWPYDDQEATIKFLKEEAKKEWYKIDWDHHEIYLNDPRRTSIAKLQTIIRYAVTKA